MDAPLLDFKNLMLSTNLFYEQIRFYVRQDINILNNLISCKYKSSWDDYLSLESYCFKILCMLVVISNDYLA